MGAYPNTASSTSAGSVMMISVRSRRSRASQGRLRYRGPSRGRARVPPGATDAPRWSRAVAEATSVTPIPCFFCCA